MAVLLALFAFLLLAMIAVGVTAAVFHLRFQQRPDKKWKDQVFEELNRVRGLQAGFRLRPDRIDSDWKKATQALQKKLFARMLSAIQVEQLENYPGIGPATVDRLRQAGYQDIQRLHNVYISLASIGAKRQADINNAVGILARQAWDRFAGGGCAEAKEYARIVATRQTEIDAEKRRVRVSLKAAEQILLQLEQLAEEASVVTFWNFITSGDARLVRESVLEKPLPGFEALEAAAIKKAVDQSRPLTPPRPETQAARAQPQPVPQLSPATESKPPIAIPVPVPPARVAVNAPTVTNTSPTPIAQCKATVAPTSTQPANSNGDRARMILELTVEFAFVTARCDGHLAQKEKAWIENHFLSRYGHDPALSNCAKAFCAHFESAALNVDSCLDRVNREFTTGAQNRSGKDGL